MVNVAIVLQKILPKILQNYQMCLFYLADICLFNYHQIWFLFITNNDNKNISNNNKNDSKSNNNNNKYNNNGSNNKTNLVYI